MSVHAETFRPLQDAPNRQHRLSIFVHRASQCLTDYEPHGDGLICFSLLNGLAQRGHKIYAYTDYAAIKNPHPNLIVRSHAPLSPANALVPLEHAWRANRWLRALQSEMAIDLVWRMHPYGDGCPSVPQSGKLPLALGPLFYSWPSSVVESDAKTNARPRFGIGLRRLVEPLAQRGWNRTLRKADLIFCATEQQARQLRAQLVGKRVESLPVAVDCNADAAMAVPRDVSTSVRMVFVGNLYLRKRPSVFCELVSRLREAGVAVDALIVGDGPERESLQNYCDVHDLSSLVKFCGKVPNNRVPEFLRGADLFVSTAVGEPYGRNIAEAMSCGVPCLAHRSGGPADLIEHNVDGLLADDVSAKSYADVTLPFCREPGRFRALGAQAREKAGAWTSQRVLDRLESALSTLVDQR